MKLVVIATSHREEFLIPLFLMHYEPWADEIRLLTNKFTDGKIVEEERTGWINHAILTSDADWVVVVDMDEFVFPKPFGTDPREAMEREPGDYIFCFMHQVWRHRTDMDIDRMSPPVPQRRHGEPDFSPPYNSCYVKPCIFRPRGVSVGIGQHDARFPAEYKRGSDWGGAHWANADPCFCVKRSLELNRDRQSKHNIDCGMGWQHRRTEDQILQRCQEHLDDPVVIE